MTATTAARAGDRDAVDRPTGDGEAGDGEAGDGAAVNGGAVNGEAGGRDGGHRSSLFREHDFRQLWVGDTLSQFGTQLSTIALPVLAIRVLEADARDMGILTACETAAFLVVGLPAGAWVDRWRKHRVLVVNDLIRGIALVSVPLAWILGVLGLPQLFVVAAVVGTATVFFDVAYQSYLPALVRGDQMVEGNAKLEASRSVASVAGPAGGGALLRLVSAPALVGLDAVSYLLSAACVTRIRRREPPRERTADRSLRTEIAEGLTFVVRHPLLHRIVACTAGGNLFAGMAAALFTLLLLRDLGLGADAVGLCLSVSAVGGLCGALLADRLARRIGEGRLISSSAVLMAVFTGATPLAAVLAPEVPPLPLIAVGGLALYAAVVVYNITQVSFRQRVCPPELLGRMNASVRFLVWGTMPVGGLTGGLLGGAVGVVPTLWLAFFGTALTTLPVLFSPLTRMRELPGASGARV